MKLIAWLIVIGCMVILQYHSINFWKDMSSSWIGYIVSPIVEVSSLFYWYTNERKTAFILSAVVVFASVFHLSKGSIENWSLINKAETKNESIASVNKTLNRINDQNLSWWKTSKKAMDTMVILHSESNNTKEVNTTKEVIALNVGVEIAMIIMVLVSQIKAILFLARNYEDKVIVTPMKVKKTVTETPSNKAVDSLMVDLAKDVLRALRAYGLENNLNSETLIRKALNLSAPTFSRLRDTAVSGVGMSEKNMILIKDRIQKEMK